MSLHSHPWMRGTWIWEMTMRRNSGSLIGSSETEKKDVCEGLLQSLNATLTLAETMPLYSQTSSAAGSHPWSSLFLSLFSKETHNNVYALPLLKAQSLVFGDINIYNILILMSLEWWNGTFTALPQPVLFLLWGQSPLSSTHCLLLGDVLLFYFCYAWTLDLSALIELNPMTPWWGVFVQMRVKFNSRSRETTCLIGCQCNCLLFSYVFIWRVLLHNLSRK